MIVCRCKLKYGDKSNLGVELHIQAEVFVVQLHTSISLESLGAENQLLVVRIFQIELAHSYQFETFKEGFATLAAAFFSRQRVAHFVFHLVVEILIYWHIVRVVSRYLSTVFYRNVEVLLRICQTDPLLFSPQQTTHEILSENSIVFPDWVVKADFTLDDIGNGVRVIFGLEGSAACNELIYGDADGPQVDPFVIASSNVDFGSQVIVSAYDGEHISSVASLEGLFCYFEIYELNFFGFGIVEDIFGFDVSMGDVTIVDISHSSNNLSDDILELFFIFYFVLDQVGTADMLHDQVGVPTIKVQSSILNYWRMVKSLQTDKNLLEVGEVLFFDLEFFNCIDFAILLVPALVNTAVSALIDFFQEIVFI